MKTIVNSSLLVLILTLSMGCGKNCAVSGRVTFPDGTPLTVGTVVFETETFYATGPIDSNGNYKMGSSKFGDGVPRGTYKVSFTNLMTPTYDYSAGPDLPPKEILPDKPPVAPKFFAANTSGLTCEVKGRMKYDISVEKP